MNKRDLTKCIKIATALDSQSYILQRACEAALVNHHLHDDVYCDEAVVSLLHIEKCCRDLRAKLIL